MLHIVTPQPSTSAPELDAHDGLGYEEFEYVLGPRQMASLALLVLTIVAICSGVSYAAGRAATPRPESTVAKAPEAPVTAAAAPIATPDVATATTQAPAPQGKDEIEAGMFSEPVPGLRYIQAGVVDRGVGVIMAEGLRGRGFRSLIGSGPTAGTFRVLIGPLRTDAEYAAATDAANRIGMSTFPRQYGGPAPAAAPPVTASAPTPAP